MEPPLDQRCLKRLRLEVFFDNLDEPFDGKQLLSNV